jgi:hypothetical protein
MMNLEEMEGKPTQLSTDKNWMEWFDILKKEFRGSESRKVFKAHWRETLQDRGLTIFKKKNT